MRQSRSILSALFSLGLLCSGFLCAGQHEEASAGTAQAHPAGHDRDEGDSHSHQGSAPAKSADHGCPEGLGSCCSTWGLAKVDNFAPRLESRRLDGPPTGRALAGLAAGRPVLELQASRAAPTSLHAISPPDPQFGASLLGRAPPYTA